LAVVARPEVSTPAYGIGALRRNFGYNVLKRLRRKNEGWL
jgi:hypothetical protein